MPQTNRDPNTDETGERVPARPHDSGSQANETVNGLILPLKHCGTRQKTRLLAPHRTISKKRQCSIGPV